MSGISTDVQFIDFDEWPTDAVAALPSYDFIVPSEPPAKFNCLRSALLAGTNLTFPVPSE